MYYGNLLCDVNGHDVYVEYIAYHDPDNEYPSVNVTKAVEDESGKTMFPSENESVRDYLDEMKYILEKCRENLDMMRDENVVTW